MKTIQCEDCGKDFLHDADIDKSQIELVGFLAKKKSNGKPPQWLCGNCFSKRFANPKYGTPAVFRMEPTP